MPDIKAFNGFLVSENQAKVVVSPAYDSVSAEQRRQFAEAHPKNFINTMRLQEDYAEDERPSYEALLATNKNRLQELLTNGSFNELSTPSMFLYQLGTEQHLQTGVVCEVSVSDYENGQLKKHESTRSSKEDLLARYQEVVGASSSPICLTYPCNQDIDTYIDTLIQRPATLDFTTEDGEIQRVWQINDVNEQSNLQRLFASIDATYLTDGHHRAASGLRYAELMRKRESLADDNAPYNQLLVALFPDNQLNLLPFHRCVKDMNGLSVDELLHALSKSFTVSPPLSTEFLQPEQHGEFGMHAGGQWYKLALKPDIIKNTSAVGMLDVSILQEEILSPILGIKNSRDDKRLGFIAGISGSEGISQTRDEGWRLIFTCCATSIRQLMDVADDDDLMPPKSTYFDPKPRSGIFVRLK